MSTRREFLKITGITGLAFSLPVYSEIFGHRPFKPDEVAMEVLLSDCSEEYVLNLDDCVEFSHSSNHGMRIMKAHGLTEPPPVIKTFIRESLQVEIIIVGDSQNCIEELHSSFLQRKQINVICNRWKNDRSGVVENVSFNQNYVDGLQASLLVPASTDLSLNINLLGE